MVALQNVVSSNIAKIGYESELRRLHVVFIGGAKYYYDGVPADVYEDFLNAGSAGQYFSDNIKGIYPYGRG